MKKLLVVGVIFLFLGLAIAPSINANVDGRKPKLFSRNADYKTVKLVVYEYKADGTIEKNIVRLSYEKLNELKEEIQTVENIEERFSIFKEYNLLPQDATLEKLRVGMEAKASRIGLLKINSNEIDSDIIQNIDYGKEKHQTGLFFEHKKENYLCGTWGELMFGFRFLLGFSFLTSFLNGILGYFVLWPPYPPEWKFWFPGLDLFDISLSLSGKVEAFNGTSPDFKINGWPTLIRQLGFVGFYVLTLPTFFIDIWSSFVGYTGHIVVKYNDPPQFP